MSRGGARHLREKRAAAYENLGAATRGLGLEMIADDDRPEYTHAEAFNLMTYESRDGALVRVIWNSRDGVTPFGVTDPETGIELLHTRWASDIRRPDHVPNVGDLIFVDLNHERAMQNAVRFVQRWWDDPGMPMREHPHYNPDGADGPDAILRAARVHFEAMTERDGEPDLVVVTEPLREQFAAAVSS